MKQHFNKSIYVHYNSLSTFSIHMMKCWSLDPNSSTFLGRIEPNEKKKVNDVCEQILKQTKLK